MIAAEPLTRAEAEAFLYREARLLDQRRFDEWLELFAEDAEYFIPSEPGSSPRTTTPIAFDDLEGLKDRVYRLTSPAAHAQVPPSITRRVVGNVLVESDEDRADVYSNFVLFEVRGSTERALAGDYEHRLRREGGTWRIVLKKISLVNAGNALTNLQIVL